jgi:hypothetical protein
MVTLATACLLIVIDEALSVVAVCAASVFSTLYVAVIEERLGMRNCVILFF